MRQDALSCETVPPVLLQRLHDHLQFIGSELTPAQAAAEAIVAWMADNIRAREAPAQTERGYQWKTLFLPHGTRLRMSCDALTHHAAVVGDDIVFQGRTVSPRGMTLAVAGAGRNAWRDIWVKLPGERFWKSANRCRCDIESAKQAALPDPAQLLLSASQALSGAIKDALALVEHGCGAAPKHEKRRAPGSRRAADSLGDDCAF